MAERLQLSILDRLTDNDPGQRVEPRDRRELTLRQLRESVCRDLAWLFNTANLETVLDLSEHPEVAQSVLNFGLFDLTGKTASSIDVEATERMLRQVIWTYEPRLVRRTVKVELIGDREQIRYNQLCFNIHAELWAEPVPLRLLLRTELNLETGDAVVSEASETEAN